MRDDVLSLAYLAVDAEESEGFYGDFAYSSLSVMLCASTFSVAC